MYSMEDSEVTYQRGRGLHQSAEEKLALTNEKISDLKATPTEPHFTFLNA